MEPQIPIISFQKKPTLPVVTTDERVNSNNYNQQQRHLHHYELKGDYYECNCGKKVLNFQEVEGQKIGIRKNGVTFSKKADQNRFFRPEEWEMFEDNLKGDMKHTCKMLLHTGARISELQKTKIEDFAYNAQGRSTLILRHTKTKARKGEFGSGKPRTIPLSKSFAKYLADWINLNKKQPQEGFNIRSIPAVKIAMKKTAKAINLIHPEDFSAHTLRKTLEIWLMALGVDSLPLTAHLGHDIKTAAAHYVSADIFSNEQKNRMRRILGDIYVRQNDY